MGATHGYAFGPTMTNDISLELPADSAKRKAFLDWTHDYNAPFHFKPTPDVAQKYALVRLRL